MKITPRYVYIYISNLAIPIYIILDPLTPSGKSNENRRRNAQGSTGRTTVCGTSRACFTMQRWRAAGGACPPPTRPGRPSPSTPGGGILGEQLKEAGDCGSSNIRGPESNWRIIFFAKGNLYLACNGTYPTCEMQSRCFKPLSIGVQVQDCSFEIHIWQD